MTQKNELEKTSPLVSLNDALGQEMENVNGLILDRLKGSIPLIEQIGAYLIQSGGKRIRPLMTLACGALCEADKVNIQKLAAAVEFIHSATLLHDDVVDDSKQRRGKDSANEVYDNKAPVLVGDFLFSRSFQLMVEAGNMDALKTLADAAAIIAEGEILQLSLTNNADITRDQYFDIIRGKTAALFAAACEVAPILSGKDDKTRQAFYDYGLNLGMAFQIADDVLDYSPQAKNLGKNIGDDFHEGKLTLPILICLEESKSDEKDFWIRTMSNMDQQDGDLDQALEYIQLHDAIQKGNAVAQNFSQQAKQALDIVENSPIKSDLSNLANFVISRKS